jgi:hypothetical protein
MNDSKLYLKVALNFGNQILICCHFQTFGFCHILKGTIITFPYVMILLWIMATSQHAFSFP